MMFNIISAEPETKLPFYVLKKYICNKCQGSFFAILGFKRRLICDSSDIRQHIIKQACATCHKPCNDVSQVDGVGLLCQECLQKLEQQYNNSDVHDLKERLDLKFKMSDKIRCSEYGEDGTCKRKMDNVQSHSGCGTTMCCVLCECHDTNGTGLNCKKTCLRSYY